VVEIISFLVHLVAVTGITEAKFSVDNVHNISELTVFIVLRLHVVVALLIVVQYSTTSVLDLVGLQLVALTF